MDDEFEILSMRSINQDGFVVFDNFSKENKENNNQYGKVKKLSAENSKVSLYDIDLSNNIKHPIKTFQCIYLYNSTIQYNAIIIVKDYIMNIKFDDKKNLPYNKHYYEFSFFNIIKYNIKKGLFGQECNIIEINTKDNRKILLKFYIDEINDFLDILKIYCLPNLTINYKNYALFYKKKKENNFKIDGWKIYNFKKEFESMGLNLNDYQILDNSDYKICSSYPKYLLIPKLISKKNIEYCASFRTRNRFPVLTYYYKRNGASIWRSSQCKIGVTSNKCDEDVELLTLISRKTKNLLIYDARPYLNACANYFKGGGYENVKNYPEIENMDVIFCEMINIHQLNSAYNNFYQYIFNNDNKVKDTSNWYNTIFQMISSSFKICQSIKQNYTILIHCSDGWDRTSQLCSLCQIILDKRYRTIEGFINLIEKDWLSFGHLFGFRNGYYHDEDIDLNFGNQEQKSPIFIQWLDAVYQIVIQNYNKFEFNVNLLKFLAEEVNNGKYGTFLFNSDKERDEFKAQENTVSVWTDVLNNKSEYINPIYDPNDNRNIDFNEKTMFIWSDYFLRFEKKYLNHTELYVNKFNQLNEEKKKLKLENKENKIIINKHKKALEDIVDLLFTNKCNLSNLSEDTMKIIVENIKPNNSYVLINEGDENYTTSVLKLGIKKNKK